LLAWLSSYWLIRFAFYSSGLIVLMGVYSGHFSALFDLFPR
jgi:hypothetical protein